MPSRCTVPIPAFALTLDPSGRQAHWLSQAERHGLDLQLERAVGFTLTDELYILSTKG